MFKRFLLLSGLAFVAPSASAGLISVYTAPLSGAFESPPNASTGTGSVTVTIDTGLGTMRVQANFSGLTGNVTASHIHCCTITALTGTAGVATTTPTFPLFPLGVTSGTYDNTFSMGSSSSYNSAFITANGGTATSAFAALINGINAGKAYFNIHTSTFGGGEIRGFLAPVPEPTTFALIGLGLAGMGFRRKAAA